MVRTFFTPHTEYSKPRYITAPVMPVIPPIARDITTPPLNEIHAWYETSNETFDWEHGKSAASLQEVFEGIPDGDVDTLVLATRNDMPHPTWGGWTRFTTIFLIHGNEYDILRPKDAQIWKNIKLKNTTPSYYGHTQRSTTTNYYANNQASGSIHRKKEANIQKIKNMLRTGHSSLEDAILDGCNNQTISIEQAAEIITELNKVNLLPENTTYTQRLEELSMIVTNHTNSKDNSCTASIEEEFFECFVGCIGPYPRIYDIFTQLITFPDTKDLLSLNDKWGKDITMPSEDIPHILKLIAAGSRNYDPKKKCDPLWDGEVSDIVIFLNAIEKTSKIWTPNTIEAMM